MGLPCPSPGDLPNPGIEPTSLMSPALAGGFFTTSATWEPQKSTICQLKNELLLIELQLDNTQSISFLPSFFILAY